MSPSQPARDAAWSPSRETARLDYLDATRAFALLLGIVFHASLSFLPFFIGWAVQDVSTSAHVATFVTISHSFRMEVFFLLAGFFGCVTLRRQGSAAFVRSRALRLGVPFVAGWFILRPLLVSGWIMGSASLRGDYDVAAGLIAGFGTLRNLPAGLLSGTHLWFLYYLLLITAGVWVLRAALTATGAVTDAALRRADAAIAWIANSWCALPLLAAPTACVLWFMRGWGMDTPDQSLRPHLAVLAVYGGCFVLGWALAHQPTVIGDLTRLRADRWALATAGIAGTLWLQRIQSDLGHPHHAAAHMGFVLSYALMMWSLVLITIGVFRRLFGEPRAWVRYVADSSYWLYLVHLPIVVWLQVAVAEVALPWGLKLAFIVGATLAAALVSYDLFVRSTWLGWLLNGRRRERVLTGWLPGIRRSAQPRVISAASST